MSQIPTIVVTPAGAANAYARVDRGEAASGADFGSTLARTLGNAVQSGHAAETQAMQAIAGEGSLTDVVTAVAHAELTLQTATAVRDRVVQVYQDIMRMSI